MLLGWTLFPLVLLAVSYGLGLGLARLAGGLPRGLLLPLGFATAIVIASALTAEGATAKAAAPVVAALAIAGLLLGRERVGSLPDRWAAGAAALAFLIFAAPTLLSGQGTFAGFIRLDDTATWWLMADRVMDHGRNIANIPPSSYNAVLNDYLPTGYPVGAFLPLGLGHKLTFGVDIAFGFQATLALLAGLLALTLTEVVAPVVADRRVRAAIAAVAAQGTLLFSYAQWGAIKEITSAMLVALIAACVPLLRGPRASAALAEAGEELPPPSGWGAPDGPLTAAYVLDAARGALPAGIACAAAACSLSVGGGVWIAPVFIIAALACRLPWQRYLVAVPFVVGWALAGSVPALVQYKTFVRGTTGSSADVLRSPAELGNLIQPLKTTQALGIWLSGDFRVHPDSMTMTTLLLIVLIAVAVGGVVASAWWRGGPVVGYAVGGMAACLFLVHEGSPWVDAKAMATASPMVLTAGLTGLALAWRSNVEALKIGAMALGAVLALGVVWSNALVYGQTYVAPKDQIADLHTIGKMLKGEGPTLMNDYEPYGARHFLRDAGGEGASERRNRVIPLRDGSQLPKSGATDVTGFAPGDLREYRSLVVRRDPTGSRPPSQYSLRWTGKAYEVWQRGPGVTVPSPNAELQLGTASVDPAQVPACSAVTAIGQQVPGGTLRYVVRQPLSYTSLGTGAVPSGWLTLPNDPRYVEPQKDGILVLRVTLPRAARYRVWLGGSTHGRTSVRVDGHGVGSQRGILNNSGGYLEFGESTLGAGAHTVAIRYQRGTLAPGSRGEDVSPLVLGPLVLAPTDDARTVQSVPAAQAASLCGKRLDWIEGWAPGAG